MDSSAVPDQEVLNNWMCSLSISPACVLEEELETLRKWGHDLTMGIATAQGLLLMSDLRDHTTDKLVEMMKCCKQLLLQIGYHQSGKGDVDDSAGMPSIARALLAQTNIPFEHCFLEHSHLLFVAMWHGGCSWLEAQCVQLRVGLQAGAPSW
jgi:hypothetical protein